MTDRVVLLHGIWNAGAWLLPLAARLRAAGLQPEVIGYASVFGSTAVMLPRLIERLATRGEVTIVGHSLGGMVALEALRIAPELPVKRVVCLGSPLCGSATAGQLAAHPWSAPTLGGSAALLQRGFTAWEGSAQVGMIAGNVPHGLGRLLAAVDEASDGTVALAETRLRGLADHCEVAASHSGLVLSAQVARQTVAFIRDGRFLR